MTDNVLVQVSPELLERMETEDSEPVVIVGIDKQEDGTYTMVLRSYHFDAKLLDKPALFIESERPMRRDVYYKLREQMRQNFPDHRIMVLEGGLKVKQMWTKDPDTIAKAFHDAYEELAPEFGYDTRKESAVHWDDVPANNKQLMRATVERLLEDGVIR